jgi:hypothetical protein
MTVTLSSDETASDQTEFRASSTSADVRKKAPQDNKFQKAINTEHTPNDDFSSHQKTSDLASPETIISKHETYLEEFQQGFATKRNDNVGLHGYTQRSQSDNEEIQTLIENYSQAIDKAKVHSNARTLSELSDSFENLNHVYATSLNKDAQSEASGAQSVAELSNIAGQLTDLGVQYTATAFTALKTLGNMKAAMLAGNSAASVNRELRAQTSETIASLLDPQGSVSEQLVSYHGTGKDRAIQAAAENTIGLVIPGLKQNKWAQVATVGTVSAGSSVASDMAHDQDINPKAAVLSGLFGSAGLKVGQAIGNLSSIPTIAQAGGYLADQTLAIAELKLNGASWHEALQTTLRQNTASIAGQAALENVLSKKPRSGTGEVENHLSFDLRGIETQSDFKELLKNLTLDQELSDQQFNMLLAFSSGLDPDNKYKTALLEHTLESKFGLTEGDLSHKRSQLNDLIFGEEQDDNYLILEKNELISLFEDAPLTLKIAPDLQDFKSGLQEMSARPLNDTQSNLLFSFVLGAQYDDPATQQQLNEALAVYGAIASEAEAKREHIAQDLGFVSRLELLDRFAGYDEIRDFLDDSLYAMQHDYALSYPDTYVGQLMLKNPKLIESFKNHPHAFVFLTGILREMETSPPDRDYQAQSLKSPVPEPILEESYIALSEDIYRSVYGDNWTIPRQPDFPEAFQNPEARQAYDNGDYRRASELEPEGVERHLDHLYALADEAQSDTEEYSSFTDILLGIADDNAAVEQIRMSEKDRNRVIEKITADKIKLHPSLPAEKVNSDPAKIYDLLAARLIFHDFEHLGYGLEKLANSSDIEIIAFEDRFRNPRSSGYRDGKILTRLPNGMIAEIQLHLDEVLHFAEEVEHPLYELRRTIEDKAKIENRDLSLVEQNLIALLKMKSKNQYERILFDTIDSNKMPREAEDLFRDVQDAMD